MKILSSTELATYEMPPVLKSEQRKHKLTQIIDKTPAPNTRELLDQLFEPGDNENPTSPNARYKLTLLKKLSHSTKPTKVKERTADLQLLEELHQALLPVLSALNLGAEGIRYYAGTVIKSEIFQLTRRSEEDRHIHVIAFIAHQYYQLKSSVESRKSAQPLGAPDKT